jgi:1-acyl-sn-glycerol-3-phosphate acyltransferase
MSAIDLSARPVRFKGNALAHALLRLAGWRVVWSGLPAQQGVIMVYPHTSNWDFVVGVLAKWAMGLPVKFWGKNSLFNIPVFGHWLRSIGGIAVDRHNSNGLVGDTVAAMRTAREQGRYFWLAVAPEGTRSLTKGWRSGAYHVAVQAQVPVGLAYFDFASKTVGLHEFVELSGDVEQDFNLMRRRLGQPQGKRPQLASPVRLKP